jgi:hypothetical protein
VETFLAILGDIYFIISWSFGMVKTLIRPYLLGFALWRWSTCYFGVLTTSFLVECSIHLASCTFIHGVGYLGIHTCGVVACMHILGGRIPCGHLAFDLV